MQIVSLQPIRDNLHQIYGKFMILVIYIIII